MVRPDRTIDMAPFGSLQLCYLAFGSEVQVRPKHLETFAVVQIPLTGQVIVQTGNTEVVSGSHMASVPDPDQDLCMRTMGESSHLIIRLERQALEKQLRRLIGPNNFGPLRFATGLDLTTSASQAWLTSVRTLLEDLNSDATFRNPLIQNQTEQLLMSQLLLALPHSASSAMLNDPVPSTPRAIQEADDLIANHARDLSSVGEIAESVGLSIRSLQDGFCRYLDTTPLDRLRNQKMIGVRAQLLAADRTTTTVSAVATRWGFHHFGRFSLQYKQQWGELPSETLRK
ncbi:AraC family transcriptional regulator [Rhodococcus sp. IEGM 1307]|jgi:AraC-like DNA-binding protein|uniref:AraC family transcriptional regulator n=1 Tax=Rhodococcus sp. IEGM 1307 TaxID=3047091 RepID=UPI0024B83B27|nr:AraC family transcriptional regulator [Rhodococcus sp. IEGM 1307]MDI9973347.1 AraC family transcriptional regulator [Rhodococcus sp. IEGM 1307]